MGIRAAARRLSSIEPVWWLNAGIGAVGRRAVPRLGPPPGADPGPRDRLVGARRHGARHRALAGRAGVPAQHALLLADRRPADARAHLRDAARTPSSPSWPARWSPLLLRRVPPVKFAFNLAQFALVTSRADRRRAPGRLRRPGLRLDHVGRRARRGADRRRADDRADPRRDRADRGPRLARIRCARCSAWTSWSRSSARRWRSSARILWIERPEATPLLLIPILIAFVGYRAYVQRAPGPREGQVPLRGQPHPVRVARGRRRARGPARAGARGLPRRAGRGHPLRRRRRRAAAHQPRPGQRPRGDGAGRRGRGRRAARAAPRAPTPRSR